MAESFFREQEYHSENFSNKSLPKGEYEHCLFKRCDFSSTQFFGLTFSECIFENCELSNIDLKESSFRDIIFRDCKMLGLNFDQCQTFLLSFSFESCMLNFSSFYKLKIKNTHFKACRLQEVDFTEADLTNADFSGCDLSGAIFQNTQLYKSDFSTAENLNIDPEYNNIAGAKFSSENLHGLLSKYKIEIL